MVPTSSIPPPINVGDIVSQICDRHPDQVEMYRRGKSCVGFFVSIVLKKTMGAFDVKAVHHAVIEELERRRALD